MSDLNTLLGKAEQCRTLLAEVDRVLDEMTQMKADLQSRLDGIMAEVGHGESEPDAAIPVAKPRTSVNRGLKRFLYQTLETQGPMHLSDLLKRAESAGFVFSGPDKKSRMSMSMVRDRAKFGSDGEGIWFAVGKEGDVGLKNDSEEESELATAVLRLREYR